MAYISLLALFLTVTNFVPLSAVGFVPIFVYAWRFYGRRYPAFITPLTALTVVVPLNVPPPAFVPIATVMAAVWFAVTWSGRLLGVRNFAAP